MYKKLSLQERPFVLHVCIGMASDAIARKLSTAKVQFQPDYFVMHDNAIGEAYDLEDNRAGHFAIIFNTSDITVSDISHEAVHVVAQHFRYIGQPLDKSSEESYAYMVGWITQTIYNMIYE